MSYPDTPGHNGTDTSRRAAISMSAHAETMRERVRDAIWAGATFDELVVTLDLSVQTVTARLRELVLLGRAFDTGSRRPTRSGRNARVYRACHMNLPAAAVTPREPRDEPYQTPGTNGSDTSTAAAASVAGKISDMHNQILSEVFEAGGRTCEEVELALGMRHQTATARIRELVLLKRLVDSGDRRNTKSGRKARVYLSV